MAAANLTCPVPILHTRWNLPVRPTEHLKPKRHGFRPMLAVMLCSLGTVAQADLPLVVESLLTDKGKLKLNLSLAYSNSATAGLFNSDAVVGTASLRYGLTGKTEIYARGSGQYSSIRTSTGSTTDVRFLNTWVGASYQFKKDTETPALIGFVEGALFERGKDSTYALKSWAAGLTTYKSIDPVVFVLSGYYGLNLPRKDGGATIDPGNTFALSPSVAFAVNDSVTFSAGVNWSNRWSRHSKRTVLQQRGKDTEPEEVDLRSRQFRTTNTDFVFGADYRFPNDDIINVTLSANLSGNQGTNLRFDWLHRF